MKKNGRKGPPRKVTVKSMTYEILRWKMIFEKLRGGWYFKSYYRNTWYLSGYRIDDCRILQDFKVGDMWNSWNSDLMENCKATMSRKEWRNTDSRHEIPHEPCVFEVFINLGILWIASGPGGLCWEKTVFFLWRFSALYVEEDATFSGFWST